MLSSMLSSMLLSIFLIVYIVYCSIYNSTIIKITQWKFFFIIASTKLTVINIYVKDNFGSGSRSQIIKAPQTLALALKHCFFHSTLLFRFISLVKCFVSRNTKHTKLALACETRKTQNLLRNKDNFFAKYKTRFA